jgi:hypothetical protein
MRFLLRFGIIGAIALGGFLLRDRLTGAAGDLRVGDCFDDPATTTEIHDVQHHPCTEAHTAEVIYLGKLTGDDAKYPTDPVVEGWVRSNCLPAWSTYTGKAFDAKAVLTLAYYQPTEKGWSKGDRDVICYATREDGATMTGSVKKH